MTTSLSKRSLLTMGAATALAACGAPYAAAARDASPFQEAIVRGKDDNDVHIIKAGAGPRTMLFIPGFMSAANDWRFQMAAFSTDHRMIAVDPRGQGQSSAVTGKMTPRDRVSDYSRVLRQEEIIDPIIVGWSMGCAEALSLYELLEGRASALVLVDGFLGSDDPAVHARTDSWMDWMASDPAAFARANRNLMFSRARRDTPMAAEAERQALTIAPAVAREIIVSHTALNRAPVVNTIDKPALYIGASNSERFVPNAFAAADRPLETAYIDDVGHAMMLEKPEAFNDALGSFLRRHNL